MTTGQIAWIAYGFFAKSFWLWTPLWLAGLYEVAAWQFRRWKQRREQRQWDRVEDILG